MNLITPFAWLISITLCVLLLFIICSYALGHIRSKKYVIFKSYGYHKIRKGDIIEQKGHSPVVSDVDGLIHSDMEVTVLRDKKLYQDDLCNEKIPNRIMQPDIYAHFRLMRLNPLLDLKELHYYD